MSTAPHGGSGTSSTSSNNFIAQLKKKPGKTAFLGIMALGAIWTWGNFLLGGDDKQRPKPAAAKPVNAPVGNGATANVAAADDGPPIVVTSYETALQRLETWRGPLGLQLDREHIAITEIATLPPPVEVFEPEFEEEEFELELNSTMFFGDKAYAYFGDKRVEVSDVIGKYIVHDIRPGEVDLHDGSQVVTFSLSTMKLGSAFGSDATPR